MEHIKFINDILKPWEDFNRKLSKPFAVQPELSEFTRIVDNLAVSLSHWGEGDGRIGRRKNQDRLLNNIADTAKHGQLKNPARITRTLISSCFLCSENNEFLFLRNIPFITYINRPSDSCEYDFMEASLGEIKEIMHEEDIDIGRDVEGLQSSYVAYQKEAKLKFDSQYCIHLDSINIRFFKKEESSLVPYDPPDWQFSIY